jgi:hypothetical protein
VAAATPAVIAREGRYILRRGGRFARSVFELTIGPDGVRIDGTLVRETGQLSWTDGPGPCAEGSGTFVPEPILGSVELHGTIRSADDPGPVTCYGAKLDDEDDNSKKQAELLLSPGTRQLLAEVVRQARPAGGLLLWQKWEKFSFTNVMVSKYLASLV